MGRRTTDRGVSPEVTWDHNDAALSRLVKDVGGTESFIRLLLGVFPTHRKINLLPLSQGISGASVFKVLAVASHGPESPSVIKIGPLKELVSEAGNWQQHVQRTLNHAPDLFSSTKATAGGFSAILYEFIATETLGSRIKTLVAADKIDNARNLLAILFRDLKPWHVYTRGGDYRDILKSDYPLAPESFESFDARCRVLSIEGRPSPPPSLLARPFWAESQIDKTLVCICHGDLHANNVLVGEHNELCPVDFGSTGPGHFLRDFLKLESDLMFRVLAPGEWSQDSEITAHLELQRVLCSVQSFDRVVQLPSPWPRSALALYSLISELRALAWRRMDNDSRIIPQYFLGLLRHAIRMAERPDNGLTDSQRWLAAHGAGHLANELARQRPARPSEAQVLETSQKLGHAASGLSFLAHAREQGMDDQKIKPALWELISEGEIKVTPTREIQSVANEEKQATNSFNLASGKRRRATPKKEEFVQGPLLSRRNDRMHAVEKFVDGESAVQRDRDRLLASLPFKRLAHVGQAYSTGHGNVPYNRLAHSLQVATVARRMTERLIREQSHEAKLAGIDTDVAEAAALAHDLGYPPFGHVGEEELNALVVAHGLVDGFAVSAQSFRIITKLAFSSVAYPGLNLTRATLNAVLRYPWIRGSVDRKNFKFGTYSTEERALRFATELSPSGKRCAEAGLMDWADDITAAVYDLVDFYRLGRIPLERLSSSRSERSQYFARVFDSRQTGETVQGESRRVLEDAFENLMVLFPFNEPYVGTREQEARILHLTSALSGRYMSAIRLNTDLHSGDVDILVDPDYRYEVFMLKQVVSHYLHLEPESAIPHFGQRRLIRELFGILCQAATDRKQWTIFPFPTRERLEAAEREGDFKLRAVRVVADFLSGISEEEITRFHKELTGPT